MVAIDVDAGDIAGLEVLGDDAVFAAHQVEPLDVEPVDGFAVILDGPLLVGGESGDLVDQFVQDLFGPVGERLDIERKRIAPPGDRIGLDGGGAQLQRLFLQFDHEPGGLAAGRDAHRRIPHHRDFEEIHGPVVRDPEGELAFGPAVGKTLLDIARIREDKGTRHRLLALLVPDHTGDVVRGPGIAKGQAPQEQSQQNASIYPSNSHGE